MSTSDGLGLYRILVLLLLVEIITRLTNPEYKGWKLALQVVARTCGLLFGLWLAVRVLP